MNILFIGLGSIAKRHITNLLKINPDAVITVLRRNNKDKNEQLPIKVITSIEYGDNYYDAVFITNPTSLHYKTLIKYQELSDVFFIEKPVFVTGSEDISVFSDNTKKYYIAAPLRYSNVIQWLKRNIDFTSVFSLRAISSSYLPDWRPDIDYRDVYSAHKDMGGGVSIDLIHEWDYISYLIGFPNSVKSFISRKSNLEIDSDDIAVYLAEYEDKIIELHLDYFGRKVQRKIELYTSEDTIVADLVDQKISWLRSGEEVNLSEDRDSFQIRELQHFLDILSGKIESDNTIEEACRVLRIARGME